jgi:hypothetical protein
MKRLCIVCLIVVTSACASHRVRCDAHLQPINAPAPVQKAPAPVSGKSAVRRP